MDSLIDRVRRSVIQRGCLATLQLCAVQITWMIMPRFRRTSAQRSAADIEFDRTYGVDTGGLFRPKPAEVLGRHWAFGCSYQPIDPATFVEVLTAQEICFPEFTFLDLGSGKGRSLLLASLFPFKRIVGVEYCPELNQIARQNVRKFSSPQQACFEIEIIDADAAEYALPDDPLLLFLFNPFSYQVMSQVIQNVIRSHAAKTRRILLIYFLPQLAALWENAGIFTRTRDTPAVFDSDPVGKNFPKAKSPAPDAKNMRAS